ncbi:hypothetical protein OQ496_11490 [Acetobacter suratthaniensis]|uniref:MotA/TolQ/ExbB proton channel domain-containing protein n=1 Tax=Acetobacter suratthaniensis TaxID=1502841 RepID=A0ABS3LNJ8_9PROT|nr:hypothetical protein [Acetobacter suratthaniensis]MBO1328925.1 hypothetical protein [Acetobacter suratthaniensis]MCX2567074.1 hypothetical protein [Acetobacter suratthaniensis]
MNNLFSNIVGRIAIGISVMSIMFKIIYQPKNGHVEHVLSYDILLAVISTLAIIFPYKYIFGIIQIHFRNYFNAKNSIIELKTKELLDEMAKIKIELKHIRKSEDINKINSKIQEITNRCDILKYENRKKDIESKLELELKYEIKRNTYKIIEQKFRNQLENKTKISIIKDNKNEIISRISKSIDFMQKTASKNILIGLSFSLFGLIFIITSIMNSDLHEINISKIHDNWDIIKYIQKSSIVLCSEIIAFFFFKGYRSSLNEIKYFHNEMTNVEIMFSSLEVAIFSNDLDLIKNICEKISSVERNFILKKGETTVSLRSQEIDNRGDEKIFKFVENLFEKFQSNQKIK